MVRPLTDITRVIGVCNPQVAIDREDLEPYYVDCSTVRGGGSLEQLERFIVASDRPTHQLLSGHRGCGKTSELYRLRKALERGQTGKRYRTIYLDADAELDTNDVTLVDLVLVIIKKIREETEQLTYPWTQWEHLWSELRQVLDRAEIESKQELNLGIVKWSWAIKSNPAAREGIRRAYEPWISRLLELANDYLVEVRTAVRGQGYDDVVLIVDSLDRIVLKEQDRETGKTNHDALFVDRAGQIKAVDAHLLLTVPISMCYTSVNAPQLGTLYDNEPVIIPMIKVKDRDSGEDHAAGLEVLEQILRRRLELERIFDKPDTWRVVCRESGGSVRDLLRIVNQATLKRKGERLTLQDVAAGLAGIVNTYDRLTWGPFLQIFSHVAREHQFPNNVDVTLKRQALHNLFILEYQDDGTPWFDLHPFVRRARAVGQALAARDSDGRG